MLFPDPSEKDEFDELAMHRLPYLISLSCLTLLLALWMRFEYECGFYVQREINVLSQGPESFTSDLPSIVITPEGAVLFGQLEISDAESKSGPLSDELRKIADRTTATNPLILSPADNATHQRVVEVLSALEKAGIHHYRLQ